MIELTIPELLPSLNNMKLGHHWSAWQKEKKRWSEWILVARNNQAKVFVPPVYTKVRIEIERHCYSLVTDDDNLQAGTKWLMDGLKERGLIKDDKREVIVEREIKQIRISRKEKQKTVVRIFPL